MRARLPGKREEIALPFDSPYALDEGTELRLFPAGHIFGSAQLWLRRESTSLLYTGDFKLRSGQSAETCATPAADTLIMETTFGLARYTFPPTQEVMAAIVLFCRQALEEGATPVLYGYSLGKSQEVLQGLAGAGLPVMLHPQIVKMTQVYEEFGMSFPIYKTFDLATLKGHVVMCPPQGSRSKWLADIPKARTAMITGWAMDRHAPYRYRVDALFPLSDHAGYDDLLAFVERVAPRRVYTVHGYTREFASTLRRRGIEAWALGRDNQLEFPGMPS